MSLNINSFNALSLINVGHEIFLIHPLTCWGYHTLHMRKLIERKMDRVLEWKGREERLRVMNEKRWLLLLKILLQSYISS